MPILGHREVSKIRPTLFLHVTYFVNYDLFLNMPMQRKTTDNKLIEHGNRMNRNQIVDS